MQSMILTVFARLIVICTTLPIHEFAHGWVAHKLGDDTASSQGRLTINPITHIDPIGCLLILFTGFGWARPVPVNPNRFNRKHTVRGGMALTAIAGPIANILLALLLLIVAKVMILVGIGRFASVSILFSIFMLMIQTNISLAVFNLLPIPPLDGYSVLSYFLPPRITYKLEQYQQIIFYVVMLLCFTRVLTIPIGFLSNLIFNVLQFITSFLG